MNRELSKTSSTLIRSAKSNDAEAWERLVHLYSRRIYRWCRRSGLQAADAGNVVQEVLRSVARKLPDFQHDATKASFRGWIRRITTNKINDYYRQANKQLVRPRGGTDAHRQLLHLSYAEEHEASWATVPEDEGAEHSIRIDPQQLELMRSQFSDRDWRMFWRVVVDGQSAVDVGNEFGVTGNTVRIVKMRLLRRLREQFSGQGISKQGRAP